MLSCVRWVVCFRLILLFWKDGTTTQSASIFPWKRVFPTLNKLRVSIMIYHEARLGFDALRGKDWWACLSHGRAAGIILVLLYILYIQICRMGRVWCGGEGGFSLLWLPFYQSSRRQPGLGWVLTEIGIKDARFWEQGERDVDFRRER